MLTIYTLFLIIFVTLSEFQNVQAINESNKCTKTVSYMVSVTKAQPYRKQITARRWNGVKYTKYINDTRIISQNEWRTKSIETCCDGYTKYRSKCVPLCDEICENAKCTAPNTCTCNEGYTKFNAFRCIPHCENCKFGTCIAPNFCECFSRYEKDSNGTCQPKCENACVNGFCANPDFCMCYEGYKLSTSAIHICEPICDPPCKNGKCISPNQCECNEGYKKESINSTNCIPKCENCENGDCVAPDQCNCHEGYENYDEYCEPICDIDCINGNCTKPNQCTCYDGYSLSSDKEWYKCKPICEENCGTYRECVSPGVCECKENYKKFCEAYVPEKFPEKLSKYEEDSSSTTENYNEWNISLNCLNGFYDNDTNMCECYSGYILDLDHSNHNVCIPLCDNEEDGCINGTCIAPNICNCSEGFELSATNNFTCIKIKESEVYKNKEIIIYSSSKWWILFLCMLIVTVVTSILILLTFYKLYQKKNYSVDERERFSGVVQYSKNNHKAVAVI